MRLVRSFTSFLDVWVSLCVSYFSSFFFFFFFFGFPFLSCSILSSSRLALHKQHLVGHHNHGDVFLSLCSHSRIRQANGPTYTK